MRGHFPSPNNEQIFANEIKNKSPVAFKKYNINNGVRVDLVRQRIAQNAMKQ